MGERELTTGFLSKSAGMRTALIAVLVLTAGSAVAANDDLTTEEIARKEGFSCGGEFVTMRHTKHGPFPPGIIITTRRTGIIEVETWDEIGSTVWIKGLGVKAGKEMRMVNISLATSTMLRKCLEGG